MLDPNAKRLREEYAVATAALDAARSLTGRMLDAGIPIEQLEVEFRTEARARARVESARHRMRELGVSAVTADPSGREYEAV
jgi:hypothetical protein